MKIDEDVDVNNKSQQLQSKNRSHLNFFALNLFYSFKLSGRGLSKQYT